MGRPGVSVIIPTLDEATRVGAAIRSARGADEVIVVDGGSSDGTVAEAAAAGAVVLRSEACRGAQLDLGARAARGTWLVFLHADTRLEAGWTEALLGLPEHVAGGAFRFAVDSPRHVYRWIERAVALRCRLFRLPYGDQAIFAHREAYEGAGGYPPLPLMEDVAFVRRLAHVGRLAFPSPRAITSARRWERRGVLRATVENWTLLGLYAAGYPPVRLFRTYVETE